MITRNQIFTYVCHKVKEYNESVFVTSGRIYATSRFPTVSLDQIEYSPQRETINLDGESYRSTWEAQAFCDNASGGEEEARKLIQVVEEAFRSIGFRMTTNFPTENTKEITIKRRVARFTRILCNGDEI